MKTPAELGAVLETARKEQGRTVADLSEEIGLPESYLLALEAGDYDALPGAAYARIYYLNYARVLGLEAEALMLEWPQKHEPTEVLPSNPPRLRISRLAIPAIVVVLLAVWWLVWRTPADPGSAESPVAVDPVEQTIPDSMRNDADTLSAPDTVSATAADTTTAAAQGRAESPTVPAEPVQHVLEVRASAQSWVVVEADGDTLEAKLLPGGSSLSAHATGEFVLTVGRPQAVTVSLDGTPLELPRDRTRPLVRHKITPVTPEDSP